MHSWEFVIVNDKGARAELLGILPKTTSASDVDKMLDTWGMRDADQRNMYLDAVPKQYAMLYHAGCLIIPLFKHSGTLLRPETLSALNSFASIWCCIENILLAAVAEGIYGVTRIPTGNEPQHIQAVLLHPDNYICPCYIGLGYPKKCATVNPQKEVFAKDRLHMDRW
jgi:nitroreductase